MQHASNSVLVGYLCQTGHLLRAAEADVPDGWDIPEIPPGPSRLCGRSFCLLHGLAGARRTARLPGPLLPTPHPPDPQLAQDTRVQARLAAVMALVVSAVWDKLEEFKILAA